MRGRSPRTGRCDRRRSEKLIQLHPRRHEVDVAVDGQVSAFGVQVRGARDKVPAEFTTDRYVGVVGLQRRTDRVLPLPNTTTKCRARGGSQACARDLSKRLREGSQGERMIRENNGTRPRGPLVASWESGAASCATPGLIHEAYHTRLILEH
jgi:hypothetical protein